MSDAMLSGFVGAVTAIVTLEILRWYRKRR